MTNEVKKPDITQEQIDFIVNDLKRFSYIVDPSLCKAQDGISAEEWLQKLSNETAFSPTSKYIQTITPFIVDSFSEKSDIEKINYLKMMQKGGSAASVWMLNDAVRLATTFDDFKNNLLEIARDPNSPTLTHQEITSTGRTITVANTSDLLNSRLWCTQTLAAAEIYSKYPLTPEPEPEPVIEKPKWFETTSKDHKVRIEQWMEHVGMKDKAQELIDKYGLPVAYEIVQTSMQAPANITKATDDKFRSSKGSIQYFLDNEVSAEKLANIPDLDADTIKASLDSVKESELRPEPIKAMSIEFPREAVSMPSAPQLSQSDEQKVHYASLMRANLKLEGFEDSDIKAAVDVAFNASLGEKTEDMKQWSGGFRYNLSKTLGLENLARNNDEYKVWASSIYDCSEKSIETCTLSKPSVELSEQVSAYTSVVNKKNLKAELASMSATETLNPETYFKDRQVQKRLIAKAEKKVERDTRKAERSVSRQENKAAMKEWFNRNFNSMLD